MFENLRVSLRDFCNGCSCCSKDTVANKNEPITRTESETEVTVTHVFHSVHRRSNSSSPESNFIEPLPMRNGGIEK